MSLQPNEVLIIALVALIVLGPTRLPGVIRSIGRVFRQVREFSTTVRQEMDATLSPPKVEPASSPNPPTPPDPAEASGAQGEGESSQPDADDPAVDRPTSDGPA